MINLFWTVLPGCWVAFLGLALDRLLRRFFDAVPLRAWIAFAGVLLVLLGRVLFTDQVLLPLGELVDKVPYRGLALEEVDDNPLQRDLIQALTPWQAQVRRSLKQGEWPLWNPYAAAGEPLLANPQAMPFHPLVVAALPVTLRRAVGVTAALRVLVALVFTFLLLRRQRIAEVPAIAGALAYGLGGFLLLWLGWPHTNSAAVLPLVLYATVLWSDEGRRRDLALLLAGLFSVWTSGHPETALYVLTVGGVFALARAWDAGRGGRARVLAGWLGAAALGAFLAAPVLLPSALHLPETVRYQALEERNAQLLERDFSFARWRRHSLPTVDERLLPIVAPNAFGNNRFGAFWGDHNVNEASSGFAGTLSVLAALVALVPGAGRRRPQERLMAGLALVTLVVLARPPGFVELVVRLPLLDKSATLHHRTLLVLGFALAYLAACTWHRWQDEGLPRIRVAAAAAALAAVLLWAYLGHPDPRDPQALAGLRHASLAAQLAALALGAGLLLRWRRGPRWAAWSVAGLVALELLGFHGAVTPPAPSSHFYPPSRSLQALAERLAGDVRGDRMVGLRGALPPELATVYRLPDVRAMGPSLARDMERLVEPLGQAEGAFFFDSADPPLFDLLGVRYVLASEALAEEAPDETIPAGPTGLVWERSTALPRLFLPAAVEVRGATPWWRWTAENPDFAARALASPSPGHEAPWRAASPAASKLVLERLEATRVSAFADLAEPRFMASSVYQDGGWRLLVDGVARPTVSANGPLVGAWLPAGRHRIELIYRPPGFLWGCLLAALAGALLLVVVQSDLSPRDL